MGYNSSMERNCHCPTLISIITGALSSDLSRYDKDVFRIFKRVIKLPHAQTNMHTGLIKKLESKQ